MTRRDRAIVAADAAYQACARAGLRAEAWAAWRLKLRVAFGAALLLAAATVAEAKTLYVNGATGDDAVTYDQNSEARPWRTVGRAAWGSPNRNARNGSQAARAGDVVLVAAGAYAAAGTGSRNEIVYYTENSGTVGNPIVFRAQGVVQLTLSSGDGPLIGSYRRNYITWDGFTIHEASAPSRPDTGPVTVYEATGIVLERLSINGNGSAGNRQDNHNGIRIEGSRDITVRNSRITNVFNGSNANNGACIMTYGIGRLLLEHNELSACGSGIFIKGGPNSASSVDTITIRYNYLHDIGRPGGAGSALVFHAGASGTPDRPILVYQNIVEGANESAVRVWPFENSNPFNTARHIKVLNNTLVGANSGLWVTDQLAAAAGIVFQNNIVVAPRVGVIEANATNINDPAVLVSNRNVSVASVWGVVPTDNRRALAAWQGATGQDRGSVVADPGFVPGSYRLAADSPARTAGMALYGVGGADGTVIPAGAYITGDEVIGPGGSTPEPPPPPPAVDCVGAWSAWTVSTVGACANGSRTNIETQTYAVTQPAQNSGMACEAAHGATRARQVTAPCTVEPPPPPPPPPANPVIRLECERIVSVTRNTDYANGDQRWTIRGVCRELAAGAVAGPPPQ